MGRGGPREQTAKSVVPVPLLHRRAYLNLLLASVALGQQKTPGPATDLSAGKDWVCPMDPDYRSDKPGICPRCGMKLVIGVPERVEYPLDIATAPEVLKPGETATLTLRAMDPATKAAASHFEIVHEKLIHLFVVSENLEFFAHVHPVLQADGSFLLPIRFPYSGMYRLLADFYPSGSVPQLAVGTLFVAGAEQRAHLAPSLGPVKSKNVTASLRLDPEQPIAGLETKLFYSFDPAPGMQPYLGAWAHMLAAAEDLIDLLHVHPFIASPEKGELQFNLIFPRTGCYRIWTQVQRENVVNTVVFTVPVKELS